MVKPRFDGGGSEFGMMHRQLPQSFGMFDIDAMKATVKLELELHKQDTCFLEYRTNFNTGEIKFVAMFEIKYRNGETVRQAKMAKVGTPTYAQIKMCEMLKCRYFMVVATDGKAPFHFAEFNYDGSFKSRGALKYDDLGIDGKRAINDFWKNCLSIV